MSLYMRGHIKFFCFVLSPHAARFHHFTYKNTHQPIPRQPSKLYVKATHMDNIILGDIGMSVYMYVSIILVEVSWCYKPQSHPTARAKWSHASFIPGFFVFCFGLVWYWIVLAGLPLTLCDIAIQDAYVCTLIFHINMNQIILSG